MKDVNWHLENVGNEKLLLKYKSLDERKLIKEFKQTVQKIVQKYTDNMCTEIYIDTV